MRYISTRGAATPLDFRGVTLAGLARDGGLYLPERLPVFSRAEIAALAGKNYVDTALAVLTPFVGECVNAADLRAIVTEAYAGFSHRAVAPLRQMTGRHWLLELFHGPTLAFKDFALQALGLFFEHFLRDAATAPLTVVGATSGDTGSAAIAALAGRDKIDIVMLHPQGRVSEVQRRQMTTVMAPNVYNIAIEGTFDDCQALVKALFADASFRDAHNLAAVNSINWTRILLQIVYYFYAAVRLGAPDRSLIFSVPTGNFGDIFAGYMAHGMGLPIERLIVATNANDILHRALTVGDYSVGRVTPTCAPSMDIQISSNFERLLFDLHDRDGAQLAALMAGFEQTGRLTLAPKALARAQALFQSFRADEDEIALTLRRVAEESQMLLDPHSAIGVAAAHGCVDDDAGDVPVVTLATAHPAKFRDAVERATGRRPTLPKRLQGLFDRTERYDTLPADLGQVQQYIRTRVGQESVV